MLVRSKHLQSKLDRELHRVGAGCHIQVVEVPLEGCLRLADERYAESVVHWQQ
jgi:hypothetical protein